jgi:hypothetical protein
MGTQKDRGIDTESVWNPLALVCLNVWNTNTNQVRNFISFGGGGGGGGKLCMSLFY